MTCWHDTDKTELSVRYDSRGRVLSTHTVAGYYQDRFSYDDIAGCTTYHDAEGGCSHYWYNARGQVVREQDPLGHERLTEWVLSNKIAETDTLGRRTSFKKNQFGEPEEITTATGEIYRYQYNGFGQVTESLLPEEKSWQFIYDRQGQLCTVVDPQGLRQEYRYGQHGEVLRHIMPNGAEWRYRYNTRHQIGEIIAPDSGVTLLTQDIFGRLQEVQNALGHTTRYIPSPHHASPAGSISKINLPDGVGQTVAYDSEKRVAAVTDGAGKTVRYEYGAFDLLTALIRPDGQRLAFGYDKLTRPESVTNALGDTWRYTRDVAGQSTAETDFTGRTIRYQYDAGGRRIRAVYPDHRVVCWQYSARDQPVAQRTWRCDECSSVLVATVSYEYDERGQLIRAENADAVVRFEYDESGRLAAEYLNGRKIQHQWDVLNGTPCARQVGDLALTYAYGQQGELTQLSLSGHQPLQLRHDWLGREIVRESAAGFNQACNYTATGLLANQAADRSSAIGGTSRTSWQS